MPYGVSPTPDELLRSWSGPNEAADKSLKLPGPNIFIPDDFSLVCDREAEAILGGSGSASASGGALESAAAAGGVEEGSNASQDAAVKAGEGRAEGGDRRGEAERQGGLGGGETVLLFCTCSVLLGFRRRAGCVMCLGSDRTFFGACLLRLEWLESACIVPRFLCAALSCVSPRRSIAVVHTKSSHLRKVVRRL